MRTSVIPGHRKLQAFLRDEYRQHARKHDGRYDQNGVDSQAARDALHYPYDEDADWIAFWVKKRDSAASALQGEKRKRHGAAWVDVGASEVVADVQETPQKKKRLDVVTPLKQLTFIPARLNPGDYESASSASETDAGDDLESSVAELLRASLKSLEAVEAPTLLGGVNVHDVLRTLQCRILNGHVVLPQTDLMRSPALYLATRSCLLIDENMADVYRNVMTEAQYCAIQEACSSWRLSKGVVSHPIMANASLFAQAKKSGDPFRCAMRSKHCTPTNIVQAHVMESLYPEVNDVEPAQTSEATFTAKYIWPLAQLLKQDDTLLELDVKMFKGALRPDVLVSCTKKSVKQVICQMEIKTKWAPEAERQKETARVIEKVMGSFRDEVARCYAHVDVPKLAVTIQDTEGRAYHVLCFRQLFVAFYAGPVLVLTKTPRAHDAQKKFKKVLAQWSGLGVS
ncbi:hypothetical protein HDU87_001130 [Geranomyces variabilis]|uniref:Uncharacterized protein n=1 Tax=Geranomyces variabilis TaxID=109894 RepID=A0AAD5TN06_9FUNG|nr:hypothetical protein HDU87_001130 [Geranomyces variabilis]